MNGSQPLFSVSAPRRSSLYCRLYCAVAPVLEGVKPAALHNLRAWELPQWRAQKDSLLRQLNLSAYTLYESSGFHTLLFYRADHLEAHLARPEVAAFLSGRGYPAGSARTQLAALKQQYSIQEYPHEIGVFLGYPLGDVRGFIQNKGQNYKLCKYWKVYDDVQLSQQLFAQIDLARHNALQSLQAVYT